MTLSEDEEEEEEEEEEVEEEKEGEEEDEEQKDRTRTHCSQVERSNHSTMTSHDESFRLYLISMLLFHKPNQTVELQNLYKDHRLDDTASAALPAQRSSVSWCP